MTRQAVRAALFWFLASAALAGAQTTQSTQPADAEPPPGVIRVACIGDSITYGHNIKDREHGSYPMQLGRKLGEKYAVRNYGVNGTTALAQGDRPYVERPVYKKMLAYKADVVFIGFGTNDSKPQNWVKKDAFATDYEAIIADLRKSNPAVRIFINLPPPCFLPGETSIRDHIMVEEVIPKLKEIAQKEKATIVDYRSKLEGKRDLFPDLIHPNAEGAGIMASTVADALAGQPAGS